MVDATVNKSRILVSRSLDGNTIRTLRSCGKVLPMPSDTVGTVGGLIQTDYWNCRIVKEISENAHGPVSPGTIDKLTGPTHPPFAEFPTEGHTSWQWFPIVKTSRTLIMDKKEGYRPLIQEIDNVGHNHRLGLLCEFAEGEGKLMM